jgi:phosphoribosylformylglycinamidine synthase
MTILNNYSVNVVIENKPLIRDPEGETILRDLMIKNNTTFVKKVRTAKLFRLDIEAKNEEQAKKITEKMCIDLRLFNPVVSQCKIIVSSDKL